MSASFEPSVEADLASLQAAIASSPIVVARFARPLANFARPIANWAAIRQSAEVDAFVLAWIMSHVGRVPAGRPV
jgi:hypothetical protein